MPTTSGSFTASTAQLADLAKEAGSHIAVIPLATNAAQVINPAVPQQSVTAYNMSNAYVRGTITFSATITSVGVAATRAFIIPPLGTATLDFGSTTGDPNGSVEAIDSISFQAVTVAATAEASTLVAPATLAADAILVVNFGSN